MNRIKNHMNTHRSHTASRQRLTAAKSLSLALVALLALPSVGFATQRVTVSARSLGATVARALPAQAGLLYVVNTTGDADLIGSINRCDTDAATPGDQCTLRAAIQASNAHAGEDGIDILIPATDPGCDAGTGHCTINLTKALPNLSESVEIVGPSANLLTVKRNTGGNYRIFNVTTMGTVTLVGMTIRNGSAEGFGGAINNFNAGTVNVINCRISGNTVVESTAGDFGYGGAIAIQGTALNVVNSTISGNFAAVRGGGIYVTSGAVNITNSTISGNFALEGGGGIQVAGGTVNITNSTFSGNAAGSGGGIRNVAGTFGTVNITNSTISSNSARNGGGIYNEIQGLVNVKSNIIALNTAGKFGPDIVGTFTSDGFNLFGQDDGFGSRAATDQVGTTASPLDPKLDPAGLQNNGGPTQTIALQPTSPAIDKGTAAGLTGALATDQRGTGFARTFDDPAITNATGGDGTDIGAFEVNPSDNAPPTITAIGVTRAKGSPASNSQVATVNDEEDDENTLTVTVNGSTDATVNGVMVSGLSVDSSGNVTANVAASCAATDAAFTLRVTDSGGLFEENMLHVTVVTDNTPPVVTSSLSLTLLGPPFNHSLINVGLTTSAADNCGGSRPVTVQVFGDENDETVTGDDSNFSPDAHDIAPGTLRLRRERIGTADGRVYLIVIKAIDPSGNTGFSCRTVVVPLDMMTSSINAVNAQAASAQSFCEANGGSPPAGYFVIGDGPVIGKKQ